MFDAAIEQAKADAIPRYEIPDFTDEEPATGSCWNCGHMVEVKLGGKTYSLCVANRDHEGAGDVCEALPETVECHDWLDA